MKILLALLLVIAFALVADAQTCMNGVCLLESRPALAPLLPPIAPAMRSIVEAQPIRRVAAAPVIYMRQQVVQTAVRRGVFRYRIFRRF